MPNVSSIKRSDQTIIVDYGGKILIFGIATLIHDSNNTVSITTDSNVLDYDRLREFFDECRAQLTVRSGLVSNYKKNIYVILKDFSFMMYNGFITSMNFDTEDKLEIELLYDHIEYNYDSLAFNNYIPYLRSHKIKIIQSRIKKESVMN